MLKKDMDEMDGSEYLYVAEYGENEEDRRGSPKTVLGWHWKHQKRINQK